MNCISLHTMSHKAAIINSCSVLLKEYVLHLSLLDLEKIKCNIFQNVFLYKKEGTSNSCCMDTILYTNIKPNKFF